MIPVSDRHGSAIIIKVETGHGGDISKSFTALIQKNTISLVTTEGVTDRSNCMVACQAVRYSAK